MHGATMERVTFVRKVWHHIDDVCISNGARLGDVLVNGWSGPDAFTMGPELDEVIVQLADARVRDGLSPAEVADQANTLLRTLAEASGIRRHGLHEISISADQAVGMGMMRFNMTTDDFQPPADCLYVLIPRDFFRSEEINPLIGSYADMQLRSENTQASIDRFRERPTDVAVSIVRNGRCVMTNAVCCNVNTHFIFNSTETMEQTIQKASASFSELDKIIIRVALSAALLATMRPKDLHPMPLEPRQKRERDTMLSKAGMTVVHPTYLIFQKSVRTYSRTPSEPTGQTRESPEVRHVRPHFVHGHWRNQAHGPKWSLRRYRYIAPQIRHRGAFLGTPEDIITETRLEA